MSDFVVGDRVKVADVCINRDNAITRPLIGVGGTVVKVSNGCMSVDLDRDIDWHRHNHASYWFTDRFELESRKGPW